MRNAKKSLMQLKRKIAIGIAGTLVTLVGVVAFLGSETGRDTEEWILRKYGDGMERKLKSISGSSAVECGRVTVDETPQKASLCVMDASNSRKPFRVRYDIRGIDTPLAGGLAQGKDGKIYAVSFMGSSYGDGRTSLFSQQTSVIACPTQATLRLTTSGRVTCFPPSEPKPQNLSDPQMEPY